jgi:hypothetical protein
VTFDETAPCPRDVLKCACDKKMEESIFVDEGLQGVDGDKDEPLLPSTSSPDTEYTMSKYHSYTTCLCIELPTLNIRAVEQESQMEATLVEDYTNISS